MVYVLVVGCLLVVLGGANVLFAFLPAPAALEPFLGATGRLRRLLTLFPEAQREFLGRLIGGILLGGGGLFAIGVAVTRLFLS